MASSIKTFLKKKKKNEGNEIFKEIIAENFPELLKVISYLVTVDT